MLVSNGVRYSGVPLYTYGGLRDIYSKLVLCACTIFCTELFVIVGKHPVSALQEICAKKHWDPPHYELLELGGPAHKKNFLYKVGDVHCINLHYWVNKLHM